MTDLFGLGFCGPSHIAAPLGLCDRRSTYLVTAKTRDQEEVITAELDLAALREFRVQHPLDWNWELYAKYLPDVYQAYRTLVLRQENRRMIRAQQTPNP